MPFYWVSRASIWFLVLFTVFIGFYGALLDLMWPDLVFTWVLLGFTQDYRVFTGLWGMLWVTLKRRNESAGNDSFDNRRDGCATVAPFAYLHLNEVRWRLICIRRRRQRIGQRASSAGHSHGNAGPPASLILPSFFVFTHKFLFAYGFDWIRLGFIGFIEFFIIASPSLLSVVPSFSGFHFVLFFSLGFIGVT